MYIASVLPRELHEQAAWHLYTPCDIHGNSELCNFFQEFALDLETDINGMFALFKHISEDGPQSLNGHLCHHLGDGIREFRKGKIRIFWFYDCGNIVVCSHAIKKTYQKIKDEDIKRAKRCRALYNSAKSRNALIIIKGD